MHGWIINACGTLIEHPWDTVHAATLSCTVFVLSHPTVKYVNPQYRTSCFMMSLLHFSPHLALEFELGNELQVSVLCQQVLCYRYRNCLSFFLSLLPNSVNYTNGNCLACTFRYVCTTRELIVHNCTRRIFKSVRSKPSISKLVSNCNTMSTVQIFLSGL